MDRDLPAPLGGPARPCRRRDRPRRGHVVRLALIYTLLDCSEAIGREHLEASLAFWRYSADSAAWIFGDSLGDPTADEIWAAARERPAGLTHEVSDMFSRNKRRREIERALGVLEDAGRLRRETRQPDRGRCAEVWIPVLAEVARSHTLHRVMLDTATGFRRDPLVAASAASVAFSETSALAQR